MRAALVALLVMVGCVSVTINVSFPQEKIEDAAENIEDLVREPKDSPKDVVPGKRGLAPQPSAGVGWLGPRRAEAQAVPELRTRTPEVIAIIESRRARFPELRSIKTSACIGETNQGYVEPRPGQNCPGNVSAIVAAENRDRLALYRTLVEQNNMPPADIGRVQAAFGKVNRERAAPGEWIQQESGEWTRK